MTEKKIADLIKEKGGQMRKPFVSVTGNPENGDYAEWHRSVRSSSSTPVDFPQKSRDES